jgi:hypothetical protein
VPGVYDPEYIGKEKISRDNGINIPEHYTLNSGQFLKPFTTGDPQFHRTLKEILKDTRFS